MTIFGVQYRAMARELSIFHRQCQKYCGSFELMIHEWEDPTDVMTGEVPGKTVEYGKGWSAKVRRAHPY